MSPKFVLEFKHEVDAALFEHDLTERQLSDGTSSVLIGYGDSYCENGHHAPVNYVRLQAHPKKGDST